MSRSKLLQNNEPFNVFFYKNCFHMATFHMLQHFQVDIIRFLLNDVYFYEYDEQERQVVLKSISILNYEALLDSLGISLYQYCIKENLIQNVKDAIDKADPIIIDIDSFCEKFRPDTYQKKHQSSNLFIYGYDDEKQECYVVEHKHTNSLSYEKMSFTYEEIIECYESYLDNFSNIYIGPTYFEYKWKGNICRKETKEIRKVYARNILEYKEAIVSGLEQFHSMLEIYCSLMLKPEELLEHVNELLTSVNTIINQLIIESYMITFFSVGKKTLLEENIVNWGYIRAVMIKYRHSKVYHRDSMNTLIKKLKKIESIEKTYINNKLNELEILLKD